MENIICLYYNITNKKGGYIIVIYQPQIPLRLPCYNLTGGALRHLNSILSLYLYYYQHSNSVITSMYLSINNGRPL